MGQITQPTVSKHWRKNSTSANNRRKRLCVSARPPVVSLSVRFRCLLFRMTRY